MKIYLTSDHGGFELKEKVKAFLAEQAVDLGAKNLDPQDDYPVFAFRAAQKVATDEGSIAFLFCRSGSGMAIAANKVKGIRAVEVYNQVIAEHAVSHNHANVFTFGADFIEEKELFASILSILKSKIDQSPRHLRRLAQIKNYEDQH